MPPVLANETGVRQLGYGGAVGCWDMGVSIKGGGVPENGWFIMEHPINMDPLGVPPF